jgi:two-component SAPR family response regulator
MPLHNTAELDTGTTSLTTFKQVVYTHDSGRGLNLPNPGIHDKVNAKRELIVVDDEIDILEVLKSGIERNLNCNVTMFSDAGKAIEYFRRNCDTCDMIISDVRMPNINGFEFARRVKEIKPAVPIILMTAFEIRESEFEKVMPSIKIDGFIQKPGTAKSICTTIERILGA